MEPKETVEKTEETSKPAPVLDGGAGEKEVCWDKPFTLTGGCCQD